MALDSHRASSRNNSGDRGGLCFLGQTSQLFGHHCSSLKNPLKLKKKKIPWKTWGPGGLWLWAVLAGCGHSVNTTGNCLMRADIRLSLPLKKVFWLGCSWIMWIRPCASWGPEGKIGMTALPALGNNCCVDKEGQGCLLILAVSSEWACWLLQHILWKSHCSSISGNVKTNSCDGLSCLILEEL